MKSYLLRSVLILPLVLLVISHNAMAALFEDKNVIWKSGYQYAKYVEVDTDEWGSNDHPVDLNRDSIATAIKGLEFRSEDYFASDDERKPVFSIAQARRLGDILAQGLKNAKPDQDIIFAIEKSVTKLLFLQEQAMTTGRAFYKDGKLNIIIGEYERTRNKELERVYDNSGNLSPYTYNHGNRSGSLGNVQQNLVNVAGISNKIVENDPRQDWIVIDVPKAVAAIEQQQRQAEQDSVGANAEATREMRLEAARMKQQQRELKLEMARMREQMKSREGGGSAGGESPEERLKTLDKLLEQGLISKEEYETKREQILKDL